MISSFKTANYRCFQLTTGKPVDAENQIFFSLVKVWLAIGYKKPFLDTYYGFCSRGGGTYKKSYLKLMFKFIN
jgi:hypothetical protein